MNCYSYQNDFVIYRDALEVSLSRKKFVYPTHKEKEVLRAEIIKATEKFGVENISVVDPMEQIDYHPAGNKSHPSLMGGRAYIPTNKDAGRF